MTERTKEMLIVMLVLIAVILIFGGPLYGIYWYEKRQLRQESEAAAKIKHETMAVAEDEMNLGEAGLVDAMAQLKNCENGSLAWFFREPSSFHYITVVRQPAVFGTYIIAFSSDKPNVTKDLSDGRVEFVHFAFAKNRDLATSFKLGQRGENNSFCGNVATLVGGFGFSGREILFKTVKIDETKPFLLNKS